MRTSRPACRPMADIWFQPLLVNLLAGSLLEVATRLGTLLEARLRPKRDLAALITSDAVLRGLVDQTFTAVIAPLQGTDVVDAVKRYLGSRDVAPHVRQLFEMRIDQSDTYSATLDVVRSSFLMTLENYLPPSR